MIKAFRIANRIVLEIESDPALERALLHSAARHFIALTRISATAEGLSRYRVSRPDEGRFGQSLRVVFRSWPRRRREKRVRVELRTLKGIRLCCKRRDRQMLTASDGEDAIVRIGLYAGTYGGCETRPSSKNAD